MDVNIKGYIHGRMSEIEILFPDLGKEVEE